MENRKNNVASDTLARMKKACLRAPVIALNERLKILSSIEKILIRHEAEICEAISRDFGNRSVHESRILEISPCLMGARYAQKKVKGWMKPQKRHVGLAFFGSKNRVIPQAKGVVGIIAPWNYPLFLAISPLTSAIAAGNRVMIKQATTAQHLCRVLQKRFSEEISEDLVAFLPGVKASEFSTQPFDHIIFTGSPEVGKTIMAAASKSLTPVTLELGGKSPTILTGDFNLKKAVEKIMYAKLVNAGQTCIGPDYLFIPEEREDLFIEEAKRIVPMRYPSISSVDYTSIIDTKAYNRLMGLVSNARDNGAVIDQLVGDEADPVSRKIPPMIIRNVNDNMEIMRHEIFGPLLPIMTYRDINEVIDYVNRRDRPLSLYLFSKNRQTQNRVLNHTISGSVGINECLLQSVQHDMPFGGIGNSGMGQYHAIEGFEELSKLKPVFKQNLSFLNLAPPYGATIDRLFGLVKSARWIY